MISIINFFTNLNRNGKILLILFVDSILMLLAVYIAFILFNNKFLTFSTGPQVSFLISINVYLFFSYIFKNYNIIHSYFNYRAVLDLFKVVTLSAFTIFIFGTLLNSYYFFFNISYILNQFFLFFLLTCSLRFFIRFISLKNHKINKKIDKVFIFGAGITGLNFSEMIVQNENLIGFIDDDLRKVGRKLNNFRVYSLKEFEEYARKQKVSKVYICTPSVSSFQENEIIKRFKDIELNFKVISNNQFNKGEDKNFEIKKNIFNDIEFEENSLVNKNILITGAAGTIGTELIYQLDKIRPNKLILIDNNENSISNLELNLNLNENVSSKIDLKLVDLCNISILEEIFKKEKIDIVFHAAAFKHVSLIEENIKQSFYNNILSTLNLLNLSKKYSIKKFVYISSDKAVNPVNILGVCKRIGEKLVKLSCNSEFKTTSVRFGNVISSSGSLIPKIHHQIKFKKEIYLTDKNATRYFMTIKDAVNLVIKSTEMELTGDVYVLNMGEPIKIFDIAIKILKSLDLKPYDEKTLKGDIKIKYTGLKEGEKLHEELFFDNTSKKTQNSNILSEKILFKKVGENEYVQEIEKIISDLGSYESKKLRENLFEYI